MVCSKYMSSKHLSRVIELQDTKFINVSLLEWMIKYSYLTAAIAAIWQTGAAGHSNTKCDN